MKLTGQEITSRRATPRNTLVKNIEQSKVRRVLHVRKWNCVAAIFRSKPRFRVSSNVNSYGASKQLRTNTRREAACVTETHVFMSHPMRSRSLSNTAQFQLPTGRESLTSAEQPPPLPVPFSLRSHARFGLMIITVLTRA